jgi:hypothetical protein
MPGIDILTRFVVPMTDSNRDFETQANKPSAPIRVATPSERKCHSSKLHSCGRRWMVHHAVPSRSYLALWSWPLESVRDT